MDSFSFSVFEIRHMGIEFRFLGTFFVWKMVLMREMMEGLTMFQYL